MVLSKMPGLLFGVYSNLVYVCSEQKPIIKRAGLGRFTTHQGFTSVRFNIPMYLMILSAN